MCVFQLSRSMLEYRCAGAQPHVRPAFNPSDEGASETLRRPGSVQSVDVASCPLLLSDARRPVDVF